jgi:quercetin dioxygenase-like cupin family protein
MLNVQRSISSALLAAAAFLLSPGRAAEPNPKAVIITPPDKIEWKKGANQDSVYVQGDPSKPGVYIEMLRWHAGNMSRPHFHSSDRFIYVISGTWWVGTGSKYDPASTYPVPAGSFVVHKANEIHYDGAKDADCVIYLVGTGPMTTTQAEKK